MQDGVSPGWMPNPCSAHQIDLLSAPFRGNKMRFMLYVSGFSPGGMPASMSRCSYGANVVETFAVRIFRGKYKTPLSAFFKKADDCCRCLSSRRCSFLKGSEPYKRKRLLLLASFGMEQGAVSAEFPPHRRWDFESPARIPAVCAFVLPLYPIPASISRKKSCELQSPQLF